jgi:diguanylate cyclase (GGDEF)-like protein
MPGFKEKNLNKDLDYGEYARYFKDLPQSYESQGVSNDLEAIKRAEQQFDQTVGKRLLAAGVHEALIDDLRVEHVHKELLEVDNRRQGDDLEAINVVNSKLDELRYDNVTELLTRGEFFVRLKAQAKVALGFKAEQEPSDEEWLEAIRESEQRLSKQDLNVMMSDVSYLGLANNYIGHANGDALLKGIAEKIKEKFGIAFRYGGDELCGIYDENLSLLIDKKKQTEKEINDMKDLAGLGDYGLVPNIDVGFANISEALKIYRELMADAQLSGEMSHDVLRNFNDLWVSIADKRSFEIKAVKRIGVLIERENQGQSIEGGMTKGAYDIKPEKLEEFRLKLNSGQDIGSDIMDFIRSEEGARLAKVSDPRKRIMAEAVLRYLKLL